MWASQGDAAGSLGDVICVYEGTKYGNKVTLNDFAYLIYFTYRLSVAVQAPTYKQSPKSSYLRRRKRADW
jgi:hypothetical protein